MLSYQSCGSPAHFSRRSALAAAMGLSGLHWLTPLAERLAMGQERAPRGKPARSLIVLWMAGGPSQLETFDPHPGAPISHDATQAIATAAKDIQIADGLPLIAEQMASLSLVRSLVSKEGDHERATHNVKTGYRPDPTLVHPSLGAIICHQLTDSVEIPRHVSILPGQFPARGGYLGNEYDAFKTFDPSGPIPDVTPRVSAERAARRLEDLTGVVEASFARGRIKNLAKRTQHVASIEAARFAAYLLGVLLTALPGGIVLGALAGFAMARARYPRLLCYCALAWPAWTLAASQYHYAVRTAGQSSVQYHAWLARNYSFADVAAACSVFFVVAYASHRLIKSRASADSRS